MYGLIDCNNFFVSCERILDKSLENHPVVVLSNNDGCIISRSQEAKDLGIKMGAPLFQVMDIINANNIRYFSPKFEYYNYKSQKIIAEIESAVAECEVYSIDEVFFSLHGYDRFFRIEDICRNLIQKISKRHGIPTSIGVAPTKTLAKVANRIVKKFPKKFDGLYIMDSPEKIEKALTKLPVEDIWGIGRRNSAKLHDKGIYNATDLLNVPEMWIRNTFGINGVRLVNELRGIPQLILEEAKHKKSIATTRSFITPILDIEELRERVSSFSQACANKLRAQNSCCKIMTVFVQSNRFKIDTYYSASQSFTFPNPTSSSVIMGKAASLLLDSVYKEGIAYKKAGVLVSEFVPDNERQTSLFWEDIEHEHIPIMKAMDRLNQKYGKEKIHLASSSGKPNYERQFLNPEYEKFLKSNTLTEQSFRFH